MSDYVGKICPVCKVELKEMDWVKVCPDCGMPHHEECWELTGGCSTFGCAQQGTFKKTEVEKCARCGSDLVEGQGFCSKCGTPRIQYRRAVCGKCGAELMDGQEFCARCGQRAGLTLDNNVSAAINQFNAGVEKAKAKKKKTPLVIGAVIVALVLVVLAGKTVVPAIFADTARYIEKGDLDKAWKKAKTDSDRTLVVEAYLKKGDYDGAYEKALTDKDKISITIENITAYGSALFTDNEEVTSYSVIDAYYNEDVDDVGTRFRRLVIYHNLTARDGLKGSAYMLLSWSEKDKEWKIVGGVVDLPKEEYSVYDNTDEMKEKLFRNLCRNVIEKAMSDGIKLSKDGIERINTLYEKDKLYNIKLINEAIEGTWEDLDL